MTRPSGTKKIIRPGDTIKTYYAPHRTTYRIKVTQIMGKNRVNGTILPSSRGVMPNGQERGTRITVGPSEIKRGMSGR